MKYIYRVYNPSGNDTALIIGLVKSNDLRKRINQKIQERHSNVEQVGFIEKIGNEYFLDMAGGEFCGNATRSAVFYFLEGEVGNLEIKVSGVSRKLKAGINNGGAVWVEMPINIKLDKIREINGYPVVEMEGITYVVLKVDSITKNEEDLKIEAFGILKSLNLIEEISASGVIYFAQNKDEYRIYPIVWVRDLKTLYYETACGSGTTAVGLYECKKKGSSLSLSVRQPSELIIEVDVLRDKENFLKAIIRGPVKLLEKDLEIEV
jgi:histidine racemase